MIVIDRMIVIEAGYCRLLWHRDDCSSLEAYWNNKVAQGDCQKLSVKTTVSWSTHSLNTLPGMLSSPAAYCGLTLPGVFLTSAVVRENTNLFGGGVVFLAVKSFCHSNKVKKWFSISGREATLSQVGVFLCFPVVSVDCLDVLPWCRCCLRSFALWCLGQCCPFWLVYSIWWVVCMQELA